MVSTAKGLLGFLLFLVCCASAGADDSVDQAIPSVAQFLTADGSFDLDKARRLGYEGPLDPGGLALDSGSTGAGPLFKSAADPMDVYWEDAGSFSFPGVTNNHHDVELAVFDGKLIVAAEVNFAGNIVVQNIAAWDGVSWSALGDGLNGRVNVLLVHDNKLIAGGGFSKSGDVTVGRIAAWDGSQWSLYAPRDGRGPFDMVSHDGKLYACFNEHDPDDLRVEMWDGVSWTRLGERFNGYARELEVFNGQIIAGGMFTQVGSRIVSHIAAWNGLEWLPLGTGTNGIVTNLTVFEGKLIVCGSFTMVSGMPAQYVAAWDGTQWIPMNLGTVTTSYPHCLGIHRGELLVGGSYLQRPYVAKWNGTSWDVLPQGFSGELNIVFQLCSWSGMLIAGGSFSRPFNVIAAWNGNTWSPLGEGFLPVVGPITTYQGRLIAGATYLKAGEAAKGPIMQWDGSSWSNLGGHTNGDIVSLTLFDDRLIASGKFDTVGGAPINHIAAWDGYSWSALGLGLDSAASVHVEFDNKLFVGGRFTEAGGTSRPYLAYWDGENWGSLADAPNGPVTALEVHNGKLIVAGAFTAIGSQSLPYIASWDGTTWALVGPGIDGPFVSDLEVYRGELIAIGASGLVAAWNGKAWRGITEPDGHWNSLTSAVAYAGELFVGGLHYPSNDYLRKWNGSVWSKVGSGVSGRVWHIAPTDSGLYVAGGFAYAGGEIRPYLAFWRNPGYCCTGTTGNISETGIVDLADLSMLVAYLTVAEPDRPVLHCLTEANVNKVGVIDLADLSVLVAYLTVPAPNKPTLPNCP